MIDNHHLEKGNVNVCTYSNDKNLHIPAGTYKSWPDLCSFEYHPYCANKSDVLAFLIVEFMYWIDCCHI